MVAVATWDERAEQVAPINLTDSLMCVCDFIWSCDICAFVWLTLYVDFDSLCHGGAQTVGGVAAVFTL